MARILVTGMSGVGKSTLLAELARRGFATVDTDYGGWTRADGLWDEDRMSRLLDEDELVVSGTVANQGRFYERFDHVVLLTAPLATLLERVGRRLDNPYGKKREHRAEIARYAEEVEPLLRRGATMVLDGRRADLADRVEELLRGTRAG
ncbi:AAA family ATPase [Actinoplanes sp. NPDC051411]|uniref:AAA family ATPase n=1 Tax=Actinoplanes sp. NPDC051411 TaxID=3155522 RepID=UPI0034151ACD